MANIPSCEEFIEDLEGDEESHFSSGVLNNMIDLSLIVLTVVASLVATVLASADVTKWVIAGVAALPAAATSLQRIVGIRERSNWYFMYAANVRALATELRYATAPNLEEFAKKRADLEIDMEKQWLEIGHAGATQRRPRQAQKGGRHR